MTKKQKIFADEYLIDLNATRAYKVAYPSVKKDEAARANASRLLTNANIAKYIKERMKQREQRTEITQDKVLKELAKLGFLDVRGFYDEDGNPKPLTDLDADVAACIVGLDILEEYEGYGEDRELVGHVKKYKLADKLKALELIGRHLGMWKDKVDVNIEASSKLNDIFKQIGGEGLEE